MTQSDLISFLLLDFLIGVGLLVLLSLLWGWLRHWRPTGWRGGVAESVKVAIMAMALAVAVIVLAESYNFWSSLNDY